MVFYAIFFLTPYLMVLFARNMHGISLKFCLSVSLIGQLGMFFFEIMNIAVDGLSVYLKDKWNWMDISTLIIFVAFYSISMYQEINIDASPYLSDVIRIFNVFILISIWIKISWFLKLNSDLGLMTQLIVGVLGAIFPFLIIYLLWVLLFALISFTLGANKENAESYVGVPSISIGYFLVAFENSLGNINPPSMGFLIDGAEPDQFLGKFKVLLIYFCWFVAQIVLMIILLNFVIALISQYYEDVMNRKVMHTYSMKHEMNQ